MSLAYETLTCFPGVPFTTLAFLACSFDTLMLLPLKLAYCFDFEVALHVLHIWFFVFAFSLAF